MGNVSVNGTTLDFEMVGDGAGPMCVVMHGWPGTDHTYLRPSLDALGGEFRLVYYDHRCHGRSGRPSLDSLSVEQLADDADALGAELAGAEKIVAFGHHHGAFVAQELAIRHPERVAGLVLVAATPGQLGMTEDLADTLDDPPVMPEVEILQRVPPGTDEELAATMGALAPYFFHRPGDADPGALFARTTFNAGAAVRAMGVLGVWSAADRLGELHVPSLLVAGGHDVFCPPAQSERIRRRLPNADMVVLDRSGHVPWMEEPGAFAGAVRGWLSERLG